MSKKHYAKRDVRALDEQGNYYSIHIQAMINEGLHIKSEIAAELAYRDARTRSFHVALTTISENPQYICKECGWYGKDTETIAVCRCPKCRTELYDFYADGYAKTILEEGHDWIK